MKTYLVIKKISWFLPDFNTGGSRGAGGPVFSHTPSPFFGVLFYKGKVYEQNISIKQVWNLSQNAGNGHFRDSNFHNS